MGTPGVYGAHWGTGQHLWWSFWSRWLLSGIVSTSGLGKGQTGTNEVGRVQHLPSQCCLLILDSMAPMWTCLRVISHMKFCPTWSSHYKTFLREQHLFGGQRVNVERECSQVYGCSIQDVPNEISCSGPGFAFEYINPSLALLREVSTALEGKAWLSLGDFWTTSPGDTGNMSSYFFNL